MLKYYVFLGILDNLFSSVKDMGNQTLSIIIYGVSAFLVVLALVMFAFVGYLIFKKKWKEALSKFGSALLVGVIAVIGAGAFFIYAKYLGESSGLNKNTTDNAVKNTLNQ